MKLVRLTAVATVVATLGGCLPPPPAPGRGGGPSPHEKLQQRVATLEQELAELRKAQKQEASSSSGMQEGLETLTLDVEELRNNMRTHQGSMEVLKHRVDRLEKRQRRLYEDIDARLRSLEQSDREKASPQEPEGQSADADEGSEAGSGSAEEMYHAAFAKIQNNAYQEAAKEFGRFLKQYPDSALAPNAQYWLGEAHYVLREFEKALMEFNKVLKNYPDSQKAPGALLKIGYSFYELGEKESARQALKRVRERFPDSSEARLARQRLNRMDSAQ
ncbi:tol-pal system protein YbgF [Thiohalorhabdus methylotrophus]|uniref:Cell division coordinator CpoB n=1 Tax=Thiohalorhabdus methylotrophus TaxID=3242694 RepID=A0ABV4TRH4_9GAMM